MNVKFYNKIMKELLKKINNNEITKKNELIKILKLDNIVFNSELFKLADKIRQDAVIYSFSHLANFCV